MKIIFVWITVLMNIFFLNAQDVRVDTIYTPKNTNIDDAWHRPEFGDPDEITDLNITAQTSYPNVQLIGNASRTYNCHGYAWHMTAGGSPVWIALEFPDSDEAYITDGSYIEWCEEIYPAKVSYRYGNHTAVTTIVNGYFISKWGDGPKIYHHKYDVPISYIGYVPAFQDTIKYYIRAPEIMGDQAICSAKTFTMSSLPVGLSISWSATGNISIPTNATGSSVVVTPTGSSGTGTLTATITSACSPVLVEKEITIATSAYNSVSVSGAASLCASAEQYSITNLPSGSNVSWSVSGGIAIQGSSTGTTVSVVSTTTVGSGTGTVTATIDNCVQKHKYVTTGVPYVPVISGSNVICQYAVLNPYESSTVPNALAYTWSMQPGPSDLQLSGNGNAQISVYTGTTGSYYLQVEVPTLCGTAYSDLFPIEVISDWECMGMMGRFSVSPNPADGELKIKQVTVDEKYLAVNHSFETVLYNKQGEVLVRYTSNDGSEIKLDTRSLREGNYYLHVQQDKEVLVKQVIVRH